MKDKGKATSTDSSIKILLEYPSRQYKVIDFFIRHSWVQPSIDFLTLVVGVWGMFYGYEKAPKLAIKLICTFIIILLILLQSRKMNPQDQWDIEIRPFENKEDSVKYAVENRQIKNICTVVNSIALIYALIKVVLFAKQHNLLSAFIKFYFDYGAAYSLYVIWLRAVFWKIKLITPTSTKNN